MSGVEWNLPPVVVEHVAESFICGKSSRNVSAIAYGGRHCGRRWRQTRLGLALLEIILVQRREPQLPKCLTALGKSSTKKFSVPEKGHLISFFLSSGSLNVAFPLLRTAVQKPEAVVGGSWEAEGGCVAAGEVGGRVVWNGVYKVGRWSGRGADLLSKSKRKPLKLSTQRDNTIQLFLEGHLPALWQIGAGQEPVAVVTLGIIGWHGSRGCGCEGFRSRDLNLY